MTHPFDAQAGTIGNIDQAVIESHKAASFEHRIVRFLLQRFSVPAAVTRQMHDYLRTSGEDTAQLTLAAFNDTFEDFPFILAPFMPRVDVHADQASTEPSRFKTFKHVPFVHAFYELLESLHDLELRSLCLVFPRKGFRSGMCIYEDDDREFWDHGMVQMYQEKINRTRLRRTVCVRPLDALITDIKALRKWAYKEP